MDSPVIPGTPAKLGVKMCGNCNPGIESMKVVRQIARSLGAEPVPYDPALTVLTVSACPAACVEADFPGTVTIRGLELDGVPCACEHALIEKAVQKLKPYFENT